MSLETYISDPAPTLYIYGPGGHLSDRLQTLHPGVIDYADFENDIFFGVFGSLGTGNRGGVKWRFGVPLGSG